MFEILRCQGGHQAFHVVIGICSLDVQPLIRDAIARQEFAKVIRLRRPAASQDAKAFKTRPVVGEPIVEQVVDDGIADSLPADPTASANSDEA